MPHGSDVLIFLASVTARSLVLFLVAGAAILILRVKAAAAQHALWTVVACGMLALAALSPLLPPLPIPILNAVGATPAQFPELPPPVVSAATPAPAAAAPWRITGPVIALAIYAIGAAILLTRLLFGYLFTRRLVRAATPILNAENLYSSAWISVPLTVGRKVLLPEDWVAWDNPKLNAVLAHERTHVRRRDWAIALISGVNRSLFWFNPLAWWIERRLATLAEQACDDSALLLVDSRPYAQALLDMAAAVRTSQGRLVWEAMAMAKAAEVRKRIELILDETRQVPRGLTSARWAALLLCSVPLIWLATVAQLVPAAAQQPPAAQRPTSTVDVTARERHLAANPHDVDARLQLILHYYANGIREPRIGHILWLVENHPETTQAIFASQGVLPRDNSLNTYADYQRVLAAWKQAVASRRGDSQVPSNAARFLQFSGEFDEAEKLLISAGALGSGGRMGPGLDQLAKLYAAAILGATGDPHYQNPSPSFAARVRRDLEASENAFLLGMVGSTLKNVARRPQPGETLPAGVLNLDDHPLLLSAIDFGDRLQVRSRQLGVNIMTPRVVTGTAPRADVVGGVPGGVSGGVLGGIVGSVPAGQLMPPPPIVKKVDPQYPPLARQARISGIVKLGVVIATDGTVKEMNVMSGHPLLVPSALDAVRQWTFHPPPRELSTYLDVPFTLPAVNDPVGQAFDATRPLTPSRIKVGGNVQAARLVRKVDPVYPAQARAEGIQGEVTLQILIDKTGQVVQADPIEGNPVLAAAAIDAVRQWAYQPTLLNGQPVEVTTTVILPFRP